MIAAVTGRMQVGVDCGRPEELGRLLLAYALQANPEGAVVFASTSEARIRANAALADGGAPTADQVTRFAALVRAELPGVAT